MKSKDQTLLEEAYNSIYISNKKTKALNESDQGRSMSHDEVYKLGMKAKGFVHSTGLVFEPSLDGMEEDGFLVHAEDGHQLKFSYEGAVQLDNNHVILNTIGSRPNSSFNGKYKVLFQQSDDQSKAHMNRVSSMHKVSPFNR